MSLKGLSMSGEAIRQMVAAIGVIASMIFVGLEIRQSNVQARAAAYQAIGIATAETFDTWAHDRQFATMLDEGPAAMDTTDWRQWALKLTAYARLAETILHQVDQGILPSDAMDTFGYAGWKSIFRDPIYGCIWPLIRPGVSNSFREYVEEGRDATAIDCSGLAVPPRL